MLKEKDIVSAGLALLIALFISLILIVGLFLNYKGNILEWANWLWLVVAALIFLFYRAAKMKWPNAKRLKPENNIQRGLIVFGIMILLTIAILRILENFVVPLCSALFTFGFPYNLINIIKFLIGIVVLALSGFLIYRFDVTEDPSKTALVIVALIFLLLFGLWSAPVCI